MEKEAETKEELFEDRADLRQQLADVKMSRSEAQNIPLALQASEISYRRLFETAQDGILILNAETGQINDVNPYMIDMLHYSYEEFVGKKLWEVSPFKDTALNQEAFKELQDKGYIRYKDLPLETKERKPVAVEFVSNVYKANGNKVIQCNIRNITERKQAVELLLEANNKYKELAESISDVFFAMDKNLRYTYWNKASEKLTGIPAEEALGKSLMEIFPDNEARKEAKGMYLLAIESRKPQHLIINYPGDELVAHEITIYPTIEGVSVFVRDVTDRKRAEEELHESEEKYRLLFDNVTDIFLSIDPGLRLLSISPSVERVLGYKPEELVGKALSELNIMEPFSMEKAASDMTLVLAGERIESTIYEYCAKDGTQLFGEVSASPLFHQGKAVAAVCVSRDITERKKATEELKKSKKLLDSVFSSSQDLILVVDKYLRVLMSNWKSPLYAGHTEFPINSHCYKAFIQRDTPCEPCHVLGIFNTGEFVVKEYYNQYTKLSKEVSAYPIFDDNNHVIMVAEHIRDITYRKRAEEELKDTLESLRHALNTTIHVMVSAVEARDPYTAGHQLRVANLARAIATEMGLAPEKVEGIRMAGSIHDIGKLSIPAEILSKPTKLSEIEFSLIKEHAKRGYEMLKDVESPWPLAEIVYQHHERIDGSGYPRNLRGKEILLEARILYVADVVEAMASHRPYRPSLGINAALEEIEKNRGILYDDAVADACLRLFREKGFKLEGT